MRPKAVLAMATALLVAAGAAGCSSTTRSSNAPAPATSPASEAVLEATTTRPATTVRPATTLPPAPPMTAARSSTTPPTSPATALRSAPPDVRAAAWAVLDPTRGELLGAREADTERPVGSLMKLLAAHVVIEAGDPTRVVTAPDELLVSIEESAIGIVPGEQLPRDVLLRAMLIVSANDAARALAADISGSEEAFAERMTDAAADLGLSGTRAANATGLDAQGQHSTARDMAVLAETLMADSEFAAIAARTDARLHGQTFPATNDLLSLYPGADGVKTGRTTDAGWCIVASATRDGRRMIVAVLGAPSEADRNAAATALLDWAFG